MNARQLVIYFAGQFREKYGKPYPVAWGKDGAAMKRLLEFYSANELTNFIDFYFWDFKSDFAMRAGHSLGVFVTSVPQLISGLEEKEKSKPSITSDSAKILEARTKLRAGLGNAKS